MGHPADCHQHCGLYPCLALFVFFYQDIYGLATGFATDATADLVCLVLGSPPALPGVGYWPPLFFTALVVLYFIFLLLGTSIAAPS